MRHIIRYNLLSMPTATQNALLPWAALNILTKKRYEFLVETYGSLDDAWSVLDQNLLKKLGCREDTILKTMNEIEELDLNQHQAFLEKNDIRFLTIEDEEYPQTLREIADSPVFLFAKGNIDLLREPSIAIVGTRNISAYGKRVVEMLVPAFVRAGLVTVSGLAIGIDAAVAKETMDAGGKTIAVLGHGLGAIYPKANERLAKEITETDGLLLSEYPLHIRPDKFTFPARNRIIAGISIGTVVAEAAAQSGSLITASFALEDGKDVFAVPGSVFDPNMEGTHHLIQKSGAKLVTSAEDILLELGVVMPDADQKSTYRAQTPDEELLLKHLTTMPQTVDDLTEKSGMAVSSINTTLTLMELKGGAKNVGRGQWVRL